MSNRAVTIPMVLAAFCLCPVTVAPRAQSGDVTVGALVVLTGPLSRYGSSIRRGLELAAEHANAAGGVLGGRPIRISFEDSAGQKEQAMNAARKLVGRDRVPLVIGPTTSSEMFAAGPVMNERKVPLVSTSTTANGISEIGPYVFQTAIPDASVIPVTLRTARDRFAIRKVAVLYGNDEAQTKLAYEDFARELKALGIEVLTTEVFGSKDTDFTAQLTKIKALGPDAVIVSAYVEAGAGILLQADRLGFPRSMPFVGGNGFISPKLIEIAGESASRIVVGSPWFIGNDSPANVKFVADFRARYGDDPDQYAAQAYDGFNVVRDAIAGAGSTNSDEIRDALSKVRRAGVTGAFAFNERRGPADASGVVVLQPSNGRFEVLR